MNVPLYVTCCAARQDPAEGQLPAAWRYRSSRIDAVLGLAVEHGVGCRILTNRFGLLAAGEATPGHESLLCADEVAVNTERVAAQLRELAPSRVVFFTRGEEDEPGAQAYRTCCEEACRRAGLACRVVLLPAGPVDMAMLEMMG